MINVVHGDKTAVDALARAPAGRSRLVRRFDAVARYVYENGTANGKRVQAAGGAKNHMIIMPDADLDQAVPALQASAFGCAGERCMAGSVAVPVGRVADEVVDGLCRVGKQLESRPNGRRRRRSTWDRWSARAHRDRVACISTCAGEEGASVALDGREFDWPGDGFLLGPSVVDRVQPRDATGP